MCFSQCQHFKTQTRNLPARERDPLALDLAVLEHFLHIECQNAVKQQLVNLWNLLFLVVAKDLPHVYTLYVFPRLHWKAFKAYFCCWDGSIWFSCLFCCIRNLPYQNEQWSISLTVIANFLLLGSKAMYVCQQPILSVRIILATVKLSRKWQS